MRRTKKVLSMRMVRARLKEVSLSTIEDVTVLITPGK